MPAAGSRPIRFIHRGAIVEVDDAPTTRSVLYWLREDARCVGTKEGCNEGDCGACMVIVASRDPDAPDGVALQPVNACLQFLTMLDGRALLTVEDLKQVDAEGRLHPAQQAMVACHGSQCGFCTPGFTMALAACYDDHVASAGGQDRRPDRQAIADALSGNLCRCTGYRPILDAGGRMFDLERVGIDRRRLAALLETLAEDPPLHYIAPEFATATTGAWVATPRSLDQLAALAEAHPDARIVAGATDVGLWVTKQQRPMAKMIRIDGVNALKAIDVTADRTTIGAGASLEHAWDALVALAPDLREMQLRFASPPLRAIGTMGGSLANGSPIGDSAPVLLALDATLILRRGPVRRRVALCDFYVDYLENRLEPGELIEAIEVDSPHPETIVRGYKISKRYDCDISAVSTGFAVRLESGVVAQARFAFGGMAATCRRAVEAEAAVTGSRWDEDTVARAIAALVNDFAPLSDLRGSAAFRTKVAGNLLRRLWLETRERAPLPRDRASVWTRRAVA